MKERISMSTELKSPTELAESYQCSLGLGLTTDLAHSGNLAEVLQTKVVETKQQVQNKHPMPRQVREGNWEVYNT
jgi:hypothetical protein